MDKNENLEDYLTPLPREEMLSVVKQRIHYDAICSKIQNGILKSNIKTLDRIVQMIVDIQYSEGEVKIGDALFTADEVGIVILQARQYEVEFVLDRRRINRSDDSLRTSLYFAVGSNRALIYKELKEEKAARSGEIEKDLPQNRNEP